MDFNSWVAGSLSRFWKLRPSTEDRVFTAGIQRNLLDSAMSIGYRNLDGAKYHGSKCVTFDRIDLEKLFKNVSPQIETWDIKTTHELIPLFSAKYGLPITKDDIANTSFDHTKLPQEVTIQAFSTGPIFTGAVKVLVTQKVMELEDIVTKVDLDVLKDPYPRTNPKMVYDLRYYGYDFTDQKEVLEMYNAGYQYGNGGFPLVDMLNSSRVRTETGGPQFVWDAAITPTADHIFYGMRCLYRGPTANYPDANQNYRNVAIWDAPRSQKGTGRIFFHYD